MKKRVNKPCCVIKGTILNMKRLKCGEENVSARLGGEVQLFFDAAGIQSTSWCTGGTTASRTVALEKDPGKRLHTWLYNAKAMNLKQQLCITAPSTSCNPPLTSFSLSAVRSQICICQRTLAHLQSSPCLVTLSLHNWPQQQQSFPFKLHKCLHCLRWLMLL